MTSTKLFRFAPSPTGFLHVGNIRTALINFLYVKKIDASFMLRLDDTDLKRSRQEYSDAILEDMAWLGLKHDLIIKQSDRLAIYGQRAEELIASGRLYPCFESPEELVIKKKMLLSRGLPPIYDRAALVLSKDEIAQRIANGEKPYWRFKLIHEPIIWQDKIRGKIIFHGKDLTDPVLIRDDTSPTYTFCSVIDDIDYGVTDIIRGEDHVTNTAIQIQIFQAFGAAIPDFAHLSLIESKNGEISKRAGGFDVRSLRKRGIHPLTIVNFFSKIGTSELGHVSNSMEELIDHFDISAFGKSPAKYDEDDLLRQNAKILQQLSFSQIEPHLTRLNINITEDFWRKIKMNISDLNELSFWWKSLHDPIHVSFSEKDIAFLQIAATLIKQSDSCLSVEEAADWLTSVKEKTGRSGKALFMPIRMAVSGLDYGPDFKTLLTIITSRDLAQRLRCCNNTNHIL